MLDLGASRRHACMCILAPARGGPPAAPVTMSSYYASLYGKQVQTDVRYPPALVRAHRNN